MLLDIGPSHPVPPRTVLHSPQSLWRAPPIPRGHETDRMCPAAVGGPARPEVPAMHKSAHCVCIALSPRILQEVGRGMRRPSRKPRKTVICCPNSMEFPAIVFSRAGGRSNVSSARSGKHRRTLRDTRRNGHESDTSHCIRSGARVQGLLRGVLGACLKTKPSRGLRRAPHQGTPPPPLPVCRAGTHIAAIEV